MDSQNSPQEINYRKPKKWGTCKYQIDGVDAIGFTNPKTGEQLIYIRKVFTIYSPNDNFFPIMLENN